jgi:hypothetical protein
MQKWEYLEVQYLFSGGETVLCLNNIPTEYGTSRAPELFANLGRQGWELVAVDDEHYFFKRPIE